MSEEKISLELLGVRVMTITAELRDVQLRLGAIEQRIGALESRFSALEARFGAQEERMAAMLSLLVRVAERIEGGAPR